MHLLGGVERISWITMLNRTDPEASPNGAFTQLDEYLLDELISDIEQDRRTSKAISRPLHRQTRPVRRLSRTLP
jgi:hypothetical protein